MRADGGLLGVRYRHGWDRFNTGKRRDFVKFAFSCYEFRTNYRRFKNLRLGQQTRYTNQNIL